MSEQNSANSTKGGKIVFAVCIVVIVALLGTVIYLLVNRHEPEQEQPGNQPVSRNVVVNEDNVEEVLARLQEQGERTAPGYYEVMMNTTWNFPNGEAPSSNAYVKNVEANTNSVYFDVTLADTEETILASPILPVGSHLDNITLDTALPAGTYDCLCTYHLLDDENRSIGRLKLTLVIVIEE